MLPEKGALLESSLLSGDGKMFSILRENPPEGSTIRGDLHDFNSPQLVQLRDFPFSIFAEAVSFFEKNPCITDFSKG
jgi:hypothetical protein